MAAGVLAGLGPELLDLRDCFCMVPKFAADLSVGWRQRRVVPVLMIVLPTRGLNPDYTGTSSWSSPGSHQSAVWSVTTL
jgi:hypothetical protein